MSFCFDTISDLNMTTTHLNQEKSEKITSLEQWTKSRENDPTYIATGLMVLLTEEIARALDEKSWSRSTLAKRLKCSTAHVTTLLAGEGNLTITKIAQISAVLGFKSRIFLNARRVPSRNM